MILKVLAVNGFWLLVGHLLFRGSLMLAVIVLARNLGVRQFAAYNYFQLTIQALAAYGAMGMGVAASRFFAEVGQERDVRRMLPLSTLWLLSTGFSILLAAIVFAIPKELIGASLDLQPIVVAVGALILVAGVVPAGAILGLERYREAAIVSACSGVVILIGAWWASAVGSAQIAVWALIIAFGIQWLGNSLVVVGAVGWVSLWPRGGAFLSEARQVLAFAGPMSLVTLVVASSTWLLARLILLGPSGERQFALYAIGMQWFALAMLLPSMIARVLLPRLVRTRAQGSTMTRRLALKGALIALVGAALIAIVVVAAGPWLIRLYGPSYDVGRWFIVGFAFAAVLSAPANTLGNAVVAANGQWTWLAFSIVWGVALLSVGYAARQLGAWSGALAQGVAALLLALMTTSYVRTKR